MTQDQRPFLIVFSGLPGTGKTTVSKALAARLCAVYLRIDTIEQAMKAAGAERIGPAGYAVANALAEANLLLGRSIVADCVNPVRDSRLGWSNVAAQASAKLVDIHLICSDTAEHRRRVEGRSADIPGQILPTWEAVTQHEFEARDDDHLLLDTATMSPAELVDRCDAYVSGRLGSQWIIAKGRTVKVHSPCARKVDRRVRPKATLALNLDRPFRPRERVDAGNFG